MNRALFIPLLLTPTLVCSGCRALETVVVLNSLVTGTPVPFKKDRRKRPRPQVRDDEREGLLFVRVVSSNSDKCIALPGLNRQVGAPLIQHTCQDGAHHLWRLAGGNGGYMLRSKYSGKCLSVDGGSLEEDAGVVQTGCVGSDNQLWKLVKEGSTLFRVVFRISGKCLDTKGEARGDEARLVQHTCNTSQSQLWQFESGS